MKDIKNEVVIVIPSLEPDYQLVDYIKELIGDYFNNVLIVDDGSSEKYQCIFDELEQIKGVDVIHHKVNKGKGRALKTAYEYIRSNYANVFGIITADSDGQHLAKDCYKIAKEMKKGKRALYLGTRDLLSDNVPFKSRNGNRITSTVFKLLYGKWLDDTQTGLRGFLVEDLDFMIGVEGERYEYEMQVLIDCVRNNIEFIPIPIETVYINNNSASHFNAFKDSFKIYKIILKNFFKFFLSGITSAIVDLFIYYLLCYLILPKFGLTNQTSIVWTSGLVARIISSTVNFLLNKNFVFKFKGNSKCAIKYIVNCVLCICVSNAAVSLLSKVTTVEWILKPLIDLVLYFINYKIQSTWVFK